MTSSFTTTKANTILTAEFKTATVYGALFLANPGDAGSVTCEIANSHCYTRKAITFITDGSARAIANTSALEFDAASGGNWGAVTDLGIMSSSTHADTGMTAYGTLTASKTIDDGDQLKFAIGNITITFSAGA